MDIVDHQERVVPVAEIQHGLEAAALHHRRLGDRPVRGRADPLREQELTAC